jgi:hypothetical protein
MSFGIGERSMRQAKSRRVITRDQYDAVLLDLDGVKRTPPTFTRVPSGMWLDLPRCNLQRLEAI